MRLVPLLRLVGASATVTGLAVTARFLAAGPVRVPSATEVLPPSKTGLVSSAALRADSLARTIAARNPFRRHRSPAAAAFDPVRPEGAAPAPPSPTAGISLVGVVLGAEPGALLDGLPGSDRTRLLRPGERVGDLVLRSVGRDYAIIAARDTTLTLRLRSASP